MLRVLAFVLALAALALPGTARDLRLDQAEDLDAAGQTAAAAALAATALADAEDPQARFEAGLTIALLDWNNDRLDGLANRLQALDVDATALFGPMAEQRILPLQLGGLLADWTGDTDTAALALTRALWLARSHDYPAGDLAEMVLDLAWMYLQAGQPDTAAILAAQAQVDLESVSLHDTGLWAMALTIRARAHLDMGHPVEALVSLIPANSWVRTNPDDAGDVAPLIAAATDVLDGMATEAGLDDAAFQRWFDTALELISARDGDLRSVEATERLDAAIRATPRDMEAAETAARQALTDVQADDPLPVQYYNIMATAHLVDGNPARAVAWALRLSALPPGFVAATATGFEMFDDLRDWLIAEGRTPEALALTDLPLAVAALREGPESGRVIGMHLQRLNVLAAAGKPAQALQAGQAALDAYQTAGDGDPRRLADIHSQMAVMAGRLLDTGAELAHRQEAVTAARNAGPDNADILVPMMTDFATTLEATGDRAGAMEILQAALDIATAKLPADSAERRNVQLGMAVILANSGQYEQALAALRLALPPPGRADGNETFLKSVEAELLLRLGRTSEADQAILAAVAGSGALPTPEIRRFGAERLTRFYLSRRMYAQAASHLATAFETIAPDDPEIAALYVLDGRIAAARQQPRAALASFRKASDIVLAAGRAAPAVALEHLPDQINAAAALAAETDFNEAQGLWAEIFGLAQQIGAPEAGAALDRAALRGAIGAGLGQRLRELQAAEDRVAALQAGFSDAVAREDAAALARLRGDLATARQAEADQRLALQQADPDFARLAARSSVSLNDLAARLRDTEVLVLFATTPGRDGVAVAVTRELVRVAALPPREDLVALARDLRCEAARGDAACGTAAAPAGADTRGSFTLRPKPKPAAPPPGPAFDLDLAYRAYAALLAPLGSALDGKTRLILVPDAALTGMPFQLMATRPPDPDTDLRGASWLIRDRALSVSPSVASLSLLRQRPARARATGVAGDPAPGLAEGRFLGIGDPLVGRQTAGPLPFDCGFDPGGAADRLTVAALAPSGVLTRSDGVTQRAALTALQALPETRCELAATAAAFAGSELLLQGRATETAIKALSASGALEGFPVVSFATHGLIAGEAGAADAGLVLTPPAVPDAMDDGFLTTEEIAALRLDADFVILSACNTAAPGVDSDEGLSGLASAFFYAGARSLLVSHWPVWSDAAVRLTTAMMADLAADPGIGRDEALRRAMLALLDDPEAGPAKLHPSYWAPFVVVGDAG